MEKLRTSWEFEGVRYPISGLESLGDYYAVKLSKEEWARLCEHFGGEERLLAWLNRQ